MKETPAFSSTAFLALWLRLWHLRNWFADHGIFINSILVGLEDPREDADYLPRLLGRSNARTNTFSIW